MSKRTVFGRLKRFDSLGVKHTIEMREDGVYIRPLHSRKEWKVPFSWLLKYYKPQMELFDEQMVKGNQGAPMPGVQEGQLVRDPRERGLVHEGPERTAQNAEERRDGLAALAGRADTDASGDVAIQTKASVPSGLPIIDERVASADQPGTAGSAGGGSGSGTVDAQ